MSQSITKPWESRQTDETRLVEESLRAVFPETDAYRYNAASIRVRVVDPRFAGLNADQRDDMLDAIVAKLPASIQGDIMVLLAMTPDEFRDRKFIGRFTNQSFENPAIDDV